MFDFSQNRSFDIVGIGRNSWDRLAVVPTYPVPNTKSEVLTLDNQPGGQVATTIVAAARLGAKTRYLGKFGDDAGGRAVRGALVREGIDLSESKVIPGVSNQSAFIVVDKKNKTRTVFSYLDARLAINSDDFAHEAITSGKILFLGGRRPETVIPFAQMGREAGCIVAIDADTISHDTAEMISHAHITVSPEEVILLFTGERTVEKALKAMAKMGPRFICCTRGEKGATAVVDGEMMSASAFDISVRDTTGAGDVFQGALLVALLEKKPLSETLRLSNAAAAIKCKTLGGQRGIPGRGEVEAFLASQR
ncbi:MAG TPA: PfkB family carbohydrate kinase [Bdellovibrionota bacterium]|nr:PfkB family carbohydrate kinase [Bdellovibrionota bacterium]